MKIIYDRIHRIRFLSAFSCKSKLLARLLCTWNAKQRQEFASTIGKSSRYLGVVYDCDPVSIDEEVFQSLLQLLKQMTKRRSSLVDRYTAKDVALWIARLFEFGRASSGAEKVYLSYSARFRLVRLWVGLARNGWLDQDELERLRIEIDLLHRRVAGLTQENPAYKDVESLEMKLFLSLYSREFNSSSRGVKQLLTA